MATTVEIFEVDGTELYARYAGQTSAQPVCVYLDCPTGKLQARVNPEVGNAVPVRQWNGHVQAWPIPALRERAANDLLEKIAPLAQRVVDGYMDHWDGHNHVARFDADAMEASEAIRELCEKDWSEDDQIRVWEAEDYLAGLGDRAKQAANLGITTETTDDRLETIISEVETQAQSDGIDIVHKLTAYIEGIRDGLREDAEERPYELIADQGGSVKTIMAEDEDEAREELRDWLRKGDYGTVRKTIWIDGYMSCAWGGEREKVTVQIDPEEPACEEGEEHDWVQQSTQGHGGGVIIVDRCSHCGTKRTTDTWAQRPDTGEQGLESVSYGEQADEDDE